LPNANVAFKTNTSETTAPVLAATKLVLKTVNRLLGGSRCWLLAVSNLAQTREPGSKSKLVVCAGQTIGLNERLGSDLRNILECVRGATKQQMGCHGDWQALISAPLPSLVGALVKIAGKICRISNPRIMISLSDDDSFSFSLLV